MNQIKIDETSCQLIAVKSDVEGRKQIFSCASTIQIQSARL